MPDNAEAIYALLDDGVLRHPVTKAELHPRVITRQEDGTGLIEVSGLRIRKEDMPERVGKDWVPDLWDARVVDVYQLADIRVTAKGQACATQLCTAPNLHVVMQQLNIEAHFNVLTWEPAFTHPTYKHGLSLRRHMLDALLRLGIKGARIDIEEIWAEFAKGNTYHPFENWLKELPEWDGVDYIGLLAESVKTDAALWDIYLEKWLLQAAAAVSDWRAGPAQYSAVLVMAGGQGIGKSTFFKKLFPNLPGVKLFKDNAHLRLDSYHAKDDELAAQRYVCCELSEIETTFGKSGIGALKAYLGREEDELRSPYAREAQRIPRKTVFCGTVNNIDFLMDSTGSRRFWPVEVEAIDWSAWESVPLDQLWAQVLYLRAQGSAHKLTAEEDAQRVAEAGEFQQETSLQEKISDYFDKPLKDYPQDCWRPMNVTRFLEQVLGIPADKLSPAQKSEISATLTGLFGKRRSKVRGVKRCWVMPIHRWVAKPID